MVAMVGVEPTTLLPYKLSVSCYTRKQKLYPLSYIAIPLFAPLLRLEVLANLSLGLFPFLQP